MERLGSIQALTTHSPPRQFGSYLGNDSFHFGTPSKLDWICSKVLLFSLIWSHILHGNAAAFRNFGTYAFFCPHLHLLNGGYVGACLSLAACYGNLLNDTMVHLHGGLATCAAWSASEKPSKHAASQWGNEREAKDKSRLVKHNYISVAGVRGHWKGMRVTCDSCMARSCVWEKKEQQLNCRGKKPWIQWSRVIE